VPQSIANNWDDIYGHEYGKRDKSKNVIDVPLTRIK
jgi:hypothetical protein